jgi:hypothetical protein
MKGERHPLIAADNVPDLNSWHEHTIEAYTRSFSKEHWGLLKKHDGT